MPVIDMLTRKGVAPFAGPGRRLTVVKCDDPAPIELEAPGAAHRFATRNLQDAIDCFRSVFGPAVCAEVLERQAQQERKFKAIAR